MNNQFWFENISVLFKKENLTNFFPIESMSFNEKLNAIVRLCGYISIILYFVKQNYKVIYIFLSSLVVTIMIYNFSEKEEKETLENTPKHILEKKIFKKKKIVKPTINNPFTNILLNEYESNPNRDSLLDVEDEKTKKELEDKFSFNLYKDINDVFNTNNSQRQFYTVPITTIPNKQKEFAEWCYKMPMTCKEGNGNQCVANNENRLTGNSTEYLF
tara:strand:+ start:69 stop:716 length:648 start_codon:yes stop_codon:yes gene_type:complete